MNLQDLIINEIRKKLIENESLNDAIATALNISYDAAHRRVSGKSKFSIEETGQLAQYFAISLDQLFFNASQIVANKTIDIKNQKDLYQYFQNSANAIQKLTQLSTTELYYSAKDIPLFYFMDGTIMSKFKAFVWLNLLQNDKTEVPFEKFVIQEPFFEVMEMLKNAYQKVKVHEVWNDTSINSSLQQVLYYYQAGMLSYNSATEILKDLKRILEKIKDNCNQENSKVFIYYNEIILLNNNLLFEQENRHTLFVPYTLLGYFITEDKSSCENALNFFNQQIKNSKPLNQSGIKELNLFIQKMNRKIDYYSELLNKQMDIYY